MSQFPDTSARGTRRDRGLPTTPRQRWYVTTNTAEDITITGIVLPVPARLFFSWSRTGKTRAPKGYGFNPRGDLCKLPPGVEAREAA